MILVDLAVSWGRVGVFGFGGGAALIPLMKSECVDVRGWLTEPQFLDALAASTALPGPIAAKMSVHVGAMMGGAPGASIALLSVMCPPAIMMLALGTILARTKDSPAVKGVPKQASATLVRASMYSRLLPQRSARLPSARRMTNMARAEPEKTYPMLVKDSPRPAR